MKIFPALAVLLAASTSLTAESGDELLATWKTIPVTRRDAARTLSQEERSTVPAGAPEVWKKAVVSVVCRRALLAFLAEHGMRPGEASARTFLTEFYRLMPGDRTVSGAEIARIARKPDLQLNVAFYQYLTRSQPEKLFISEKEAAAVYHAAPERFLRQEKIVYGFLKIPGPLPEAEKTAQSVRAQLLQGVSFDVVAAKINPQGPGELPPELAEMVVRAFPKIQKYAVTEPLAVRGSVYLVQIRAFEAARLSTLEESLPYIRLKLSLDRVSAFMKEVLQQELSRHPIRYEGALK